jgi:hypothetical protein
MTIKVELPRSEEGLRKGGHSRPVNSTLWGHNGFVAPTNTPAGDPAYTNIGSHGPKPAPQLQPGASEASPRGEKAAGAPRARVAASPPGMIGRRK